MAIKPIWWLIGGGAVLIAMMVATYKTILERFLPQWEGFSATPYWDVSRWSWGYGTPAPSPSTSPGATISRDQAMQDALSHVNSDYAYLKGLISRNLTANQWAALLSFSYNLGSGNADNLVQNINAGDDDDLEYQWKQYVNAGGQPSQDLINRRAAEWQLWQS